MYSFDPQPRLPTFEEILSSASIYRLAFRMGEQTDELVVANL